MCQYRSSKKLHKKMLNTQSQIIAFIKKTNALRKTYDNKVGVNADLAKLI